MISLIEFLLFTIFLKYANIYRKNRPNWKKNHQKTMFSYGIRKLFNFGSISAHQTSKFNWNDFYNNFCKKLWKKKDNTWNIRYLVDKSFVPGTQRMILKIVRCYYWSSFFFFRMEMNQEHWYWWQAMAYNIHRCNFLQARNKWLRSRNSVIYTNP